MAEINIELTAREAKVINWLNSATTVDNHRVVLDYIFIDKEFMVASDGKVINISRITPAFQRYIGMLVSPKKKAKKGRCVFDVGEGKYVSWKSVTPSKNKMYHHTIKADALGRAIKHTEMVSLTAYDRFAAMISLDSDLGRSYVYVENPKDWQSPETTNDVFYTNSGFAIPSYTADQMVINTNASKLPHVEIKVADNETINLTGSQAERFLYWLKTRNRGDLE